MADNSLSPSRRFLLNRSLLITLAGVFLSCALLSALVTNKFIDGLAQGLGMSLGTLLMGLLIELGRGRVKNRTFNTISFAKICGIFIVLPIQTSSISV